MQRHKAAKLEAEMTGGKVEIVSLMVGPVTRHEKPLLLVISGNGWAPIWMMFMSSPDINTCPW
jgi:hypothetical protein